MRITNSMMANSHIKNLQNNLQRLDKLNLQMDTAKQVNKLSDDPYKAIRIINLQSEIDGMEKYNYNTDETKGFLETTDSSLDQLGNIASQIKESLIQASSQTNGEHEVKAIGQKVDELIKQAGELLNTTYGGKYIFGGSATNEKPFEVLQNIDGTVTIQNITELGKLNEEMKVELSPGISMNYNVNFGDFNGEDNFKTLNDISKAFSTSNQDELRKLINNVDTLINDVINTRATVGVKVNTVDAVKEKNDQAILNMQSELSQKQDVAIMEKYIELTQAQMTYSASLQVGAKIIQPTILDFLR